MSVTINADQFNAVFQVSIRLSEQLYLKYLNGQSYFWGDEAHFLNLAEIIRLLYTPECTFLSRCLLNSVMKALELVTIRSQKDVYISCFIKSTAEPVEGEEDSWTAVREAYHSLMELPDFAPFATVLPTKDELLNASI